MQETKNLFSSLLGLLTPEDINALTSVGGAAQRQNLVEMVDTYLVKKQELLGAKILPFQSPAKVEIQGQVAVNEKQVVNGTSISVASTETNEEGPPLQETSNYVDLSAHKEKIAASQFILQEKERLKVSQKRLKSKEVIDLYQKSTAVNVEEERKMKDDMTKSNNVGVLVNKKHY